MNSVIISKNEIKELNNEQLYSLNKFQLEHFRKTLNIEVGSQIKGTILNDSICKLEVKSIGDQEIILKILSKENGIRSKIEILIGASRPQTMKKVIEHGTTLGVSKFHIFKADLSEKSYLQSKVYQADEFKELCHLGLSQSTCFINEPQISLYKNIYEANEGITSNNKFILSPFSQRKLHSMELNKEVDSPILAIGPERGWTESEVSFLKNNSFNDYCLGPSILRVEHALFSSLGFFSQIY